MDSPITRAEYEEFRRRIEGEYNRQEKRIELLEGQTGQFINIAISVKELALSVKQMAETQKAQGEKLERLEDQDAEMWRQVIRYTVIAIVGIVIGFVFKRIGM